ncbi:MAG TPA: adhesin, partial [bacterium]|nr:adhesin [bacterium]
QLLAGRPSLDQLDAEELAKAKTILADRDSAEQLLQARLQDAPLPRPQATPTSAPPLATPTPIP